MQKLKDIIFTFTGISTCVLIATTLFITVFYGNIEVRVSLLWQMLGCDVLCTLGNFLYTKHETSKKKLYLITILHYLYINIVVLGCGLYFEWFYINRIDMIVSMIIIIAVIFLLVSALNIIRTKKDSELMNMRLHEYLHKDEQKKS